jgi:hypothetical protein
VDGGGLANWWSVLNRIVEVEKYQIDGAVFTVYSGDLRRGFSISEHQGYGQSMFGRVPSWNPRYFPFTGEQAKAFFQPWDASIVGSKEFDAALKGDWSPPSPVPYLAGLLAREILRPAFRRVGMSLRGVVDIESERRAMIQDIRRVLKSMNIPALVVYIPDRGSLIDQGAPGEIDTDTREFAAWIEAECVNGGLAFNGRTASQIRADWLPYDGHWGQGGSDRFAEFMVEILAHWSGGSPDRRAAWHGWLQ